MLAKEYNPRVGTNPLTFYWIAYYNDGQCLPQFDPIDGHENFFRDIDQSRLIKFGLYSFTEEMIRTVKEPFRIVPYPLPRFEVQLNENQRLIFFRRGRITKQGKMLPTEYFLGWQENDSDGRNRKILMRIDEQGNVELRAES